MNIIAPVKLFLSANSSSIMVGLGIAGVGVTAVASGKAAVKAHTILEEMHYTSEVEPTNKEKFKAVAPVFILPAACGLATVGLFCGAHAVDLKKQAALLSVAMASKRTAEETEKKVVELFGDKKAKQVKDEIAKDEVRKDPPKKEDIWRTGNGTIIMRDGVMGGPDFETDLEMLKAVFNQLNSRLNNYEYVTVNDLKYALNLPQIEIGDDLGWAGGEQLEPYWTVVDLEKDLMMTTEEDFRDIYVLKYNLPAYLPNS